MVLNGSTSTFGWILKVWKEFFSNKDFFNAERWLNFKELSLIAAEDPFVKSYANVSSVKLKNVLGKSKPVNKYEFIIADSVESWLTELKINSAFLNTLPAGMFHDLVSTVIKDLSPFASDIDKLVVSIPLRSGGVRIVKSSMMLWVLSVSIIRVSLAKCLK